MSRESSRAQHVCIDNGCDVTCCLESLLPQFPRSDRQLRTVSLLPLGYFGLDICHGSEKGNYGI